MKRFWPLILMAIGLVLFLTGFLGEGLPARPFVPGSTGPLPGRDPASTGTAQAVKWFGETLLLFAVFAGVIPLVVRRFRPPAPKKP